MSSTYIAAVRVLPDAVGPSPVVAGLRGAFVSADAETAIHQRKKSSDDRREAALRFIPEFTSQSCLTQEQQNMQKGKAGVTVCVRGFDKSAGVVDFKEIRRPTAGSERGRSVEVTFAPSSS
jgi:hypothetical protein